MNGTLNVLSFSGGAFHAPVADLAGDHPCSLAFQLPYAIARAFYHLRRLVEHVRPIRRAVHLQIAFKSTKATTPVDKTRHRAKNGTVGHKEIVQHHEKIFISLDRLRTRTSTRTSLSFLDAAAFATCPLSRGLLRGSKESRSHSSAERRSDWFYISSSAVHILVDLPWASLCKRANSIDH